MQAQPADELNVDNVNGLSRPSVFEVRKILQEVQMSMAFVDRPTYSQQQQQLAGTEIRARLIVSRLQAPRIMEFRRRGCIGPNK
jgi:hypothetical protein